MDAGIILDEVTQNGEYTIHCFERYEYVVHPSNSNAVVINSRPQNFVKTDGLIRKENRQYNRDKRKQTYRKGDLLC